MKYGRWTVLEQNTKARWLCKCDCGIIKEVQSRFLRAGRSKSCGCYSKDHMRDWVGRPVFSPTRKRTNTCWRDMKRRCYQPQRKDYKNYGARGIGVCARWRKSFDNFVADMGEKPDNRTLDRINSNGDYCKKNCRWATLEEQYTNKTNTITLVYQGQKYIIPSLAKKLNMHSDKLRSMVRQNPAKVLSLGIHIKRPKSNKV